MNARMSSKASSRLKKALQRAERLTSVPIEVLIVSDTSHERLVERLAMLSKRGLVTPGQALIAVDPVRRHVALGLSRELEGELDAGEIRAWLRGLQEDLHMTAFENALSLAVLSLALAFSEKLPAVTMEAEHPA